MTNIKLFRGFIQLHFLFKIVLKDESEFQHSVSRDTVLSYLKVGSGYFGFLIILIILLASQGFSVFTNFWLTNWYFFKKFNLNVSLKQCLNNLSLKGH